jgi:hypothetical protein
MNAVEEIFGLVKEIEEESKKTLINSSSWINIDFR